MKEGLWSCSIENKQCPHCNKNINIYVISHKSEKDLIKEFYKRIIFHVKNDCDNKKIKKINPLVIKKKLISNVDIYEKINLIF